MSISRRDALMGATAAAVVTGAATAPLAMKAAGVKAALGGVPRAVQGDSALRQRYAEWKAAHQAFGRVLDDLAKVERKFWPVAKERGIECGTEAYKALGCELGVDAAHDNEARASDQEEEAYERFLNTPAGSLQGLVLKVQTAQKNEDSAAESVLVEALSRDLERLAGGMRP